MPRRKEPRIRDAVLDQLLAGADPSTAFDPNGLPDGLKEALAERALDAGMDHHLTGSDGADSRIGHGKKTVLTDAGRIELEAPRDRRASLDPRPIAERQRRSPGFDDKVVPMYARGASTRGIRGHLRRPRGIEVFPDLISAVTDAVLDEVATWRARPPEPVYPLVLFDAPRVEVRDEGLVRDEAAHIALGVRADGTKEVLGLWLQRSEGAEFRPRVMTGPRTRGIGDDVLVAVVDGLKGSPEAIAAVLPEAAVQTCIVRLPRRSPALVAHEDREAVAAALKEVCRAVDAAGGEAAPAALEEGPWGRRRPAIGRGWRRAWGEAAPFPAFPGEVRRLLYTTNAIEALNPKPRRAVRARGRFPADEAATRLLFPASNRAERGWRMPPASGRRPRPGPPSSSASASPRPWPADGRPPARTRNSWQVPADRIGVDDTGTRHRRRNAVCTRLGNDRFAAFVATAPKSRLNLLEAPRAGHADCVIDAEALAHMRQRAPAGPVIARLAEHPERHFPDEAAWFRHLDQLGIAALAVTPDPVRIATEGAIRGSVKAHGLLPDTVILSDDAGQFALHRHALRWVHAERLARKLDAFTERQHAAQQFVRAPDRRRRLRARFDRIFRRRAGFATLDRLLARPHAEKEELLVVLERPEAPPRANGSGRDLRPQAVERKISGGTRSDQGRACRDAFLGPPLTCAKLGLSFRDHLGHHLQAPGADAPHLPDLVRLRPTLA